MAYLGNAPARSFISFERQVFTIVNSQTAYTLSHSVTNENDIRLVINNIVQEPGSGKAYTASGTTLTLSAALTNGTDEMYCVFLGKAVGTVNAPAGSINNSQISYPLAQSGAVVSSFNRTSSDGNILELQKDGTVIGSIGNKAANIFMTNNSSNNTGFKINPDAITPSTSTGTDRDNAIDLGASGAAYKDLYLGGGLLVGGTGTANKLDDYEEGTFTPAYNAGTSGGSYSYQVGEYTKIGNLCFFQIQIQGSGMSATTSQLSISGLPFSSDSGSPYGGATININFNFRSDGDITSHVPSNSTLLYFYQNNGTSFLGTEATNINAGLLLHGYYRTA
jgi:hypothetical protein